MAESAMESARIGQEISRLRKQIGISATELARRAGLSQSQISRLENGQQGFRSHTLARLSKALGVSPAHFFINELDDVRKDRQRNQEARRELGKTLAEEIRERYGEIAVTPAYSNFLKRLAKALARRATDPKLLRRALDQVLRMDEEELRALINGSPAATSRKPKA